MLLKTRNALNRVLTQPFRSKETNALHVIHRITRSRLKKMGEETHSHETNSNHHMQLQFLHISTIILLRTPNEMHVNCYSSPRHHITQQWGETSKAQHHLHARIKASNLKSMHYLPQKVSFGLDLEWGHRNSLIAPGISGESFSYACQREKT